jgi:hypothetical protein
LRWEAVVADDIVTRLRTVDIWDDAVGLMDRAADEIERLHAEINDLRLRLVALSIPKDTDRGDGFGSVAVADSVAQEETDD